MTSKHRIIPIFVPHVGCPNDCVFCNQRKISGTLLPATAESVERDIRTALESIGSYPAEVAFYGGSFTAIPQSEQFDLLGAVSPFLRSGQVEGIRLSTRPDCIREEHVRLLKEYGVRTIELGAQSMDDEVLRLSGRGHTAADTAAAAEIIRKCGVSLMLQMMTGLPGDTPEKSMNTARAIADLKPDGVRIYPTVIIKDTKLYDMWRSGEYKEHTVGQAVSLCADIAALFRARGIPIIRLGLNPTDDLSAGEAAAGAYHPALGELVYSRIYLNAAQKELKRAGDIAGADVVIGVAPGKVSLMTGQKRSNIHTLISMFGLKSVKVRETDIKDGETVILNIEKKTYF